MRWYKWLNTKSKLVGFGYHVWHCIVAMLFFIGGIILGLPIAGAASGILFYWVREYLQYLKIGKEFIWLDAIYPTITNTILYIFYIL
jgi:hypothetical protein